MTLAGVWEETFPFRALRGFVWVDTSVKTPAWRRRHSRRACFPGQGRGGPPKGAAGTPWRLGRSCHPTQLTSQQCTQMPQNGSEGPFSPICVHSCVPGRSRDPRVATVYTNALKRLRETIFANLCTLLRPRPLARSSCRNSVHKCPKTAPRDHFRQSVYTVASSSPWW